MKIIPISIFTAVLLSFVLSTTAFAQSEKNEMERAVGRDEIPENALELIDEFWPDLQGIKYFLETDGNLTTYEAKLDWGGDQFSIEFSTDGYVLDVEKLISFETIPESVRNAITSHLDSQFDRYRLTRIQQQFIARDEDDEDDSDFIDDILEGDAEDYEIRYEIVLDGQNKQELGSFEKLYSNSGSILEKRKVVRRSLDNIW